MYMNRRDLLKSASWGAAILSGVSPGELLAKASAKNAEKKSANTYKHRVAFGCWINDMRLENLPLQVWPAPQLDDMAIDSAIRALCVQSAAGYNYLDVWGLLATYAYPPDITSILDKPRRRQINRLISAAAERGMKVIHGMGTYSWGFDKIIEADPEVRGVRSKGAPHPHAMCGANPKSFEYVKKILHLALDNFDFGGIHLESCDQGCCACPKCSGVRGRVAYNVELNIRTADYIRSHWPEKLIICIPLSWKRPGQHYDEEEKKHIRALSRHIDCFMDQGHDGLYVGEEGRREFIESLDCDYGTSGGLFCYHSERLDRNSYFLPYPIRTYTTIKEHFDFGARGSMIYQGPMNNPGVEMTAAVAGRILSNVSRDVDDALAEAVELYYKPRDAAARDKVAEIFKRAEDAYFANWKAKTAGTFFIGRLREKSPDPAVYLTNERLTAQGRRAYKQGLISILKDLPGLEGRLDDRGRLANIRKGIVSTLMLLNTIACCYGEK